MNKANVAAKLFETGTQVYKDSFGDTIKTRGCKRFAQPIKVEVDEDTTIEVYGVYITESGIELDTSSVLEPTENGWATIYNEI